MSRVTLLMKFVHDFAHAILFIIGLLYVFSLLDPETKESLEAYDMWFHVIGGPLFLYLSLDSLRDWWKHGGMRDRIRRLFGRTWNEPVPSHIVAESYPWRDSGDGEYDGFRLVFPGEPAPPRAETRATPVEKCPTCRHGVENSRSANEANYGGP